MQINNQYNYNVNFEGYQVANVKNIIGNKTTHIDIYKLDSGDREFINNLAKKIDYKKLCPQLSEFEQNRWQKIFNFCTEQYKGIDSKTYLAISNNEPCGILTFSGENGLHLNGICSIPNSKCEKIPFVGKSLFLHLFKIAKNAKSKSIELEAVTDGPINVIKKYENLGFKTIGCSAIGYLDMIINKFKIEKQVETLSNELKYTEIRPIKVDMNIFID